MSSYGVISNFEGQSCNRSIYCVIGSCSIVCPSQCIWRSIFGFMRLCPKHAGVCNFCQGQNATVIFYFNCSSNYSGIITKTYSYINRITGFSSNAFRQYFCIAYSIYCYCECGCFTTIFNRNCLSTGRSRAEPAGCKTATCI